MRGGWKGVRFGKSGMREAKVRIEKAKAYSHEELLMYQAVKRPQN